MTTTFYNLPVEVAPRYSFYETLDGYDFRFVISWNDYEDAWYLDLIGLTDETLTFYGIKLVPGVNLLSSFGIRDRITGVLTVVDESGENENPTYADIGDRFNLVYITE